jgi:hypothetical protein
MAGISEVGPGTKMAAVTGHYQYPNVRFITQGKCGVLDLPQVLVVHRVGFIYAIEAQPCDVAIVLKFQVFVGVRLTLHAVMIADLQKCGAKAA